jgi:hypothetical protein
MFKITGKTIQLTRGDTAFIEIIPKIANEEVYKLGESDSLILTVKESTTRQDVVFQKTLTSESYLGEDNNRLVFEIQPDDTNGLRYKDYYYDVQLSLDNGARINTIIQPNVFRIADEVTF